MRRVWLALVITIALLALSGWWAFRPTQDRLAQGETSAATGTPGIGTYARGREEWAERASRSQTRTPTQINRTDGPKPHSWATSDPLASASDWAASPVPSPPPTLPEETPTPVEESAPAPSLAPASDGLDWDALAECESSGNPRVVSSNGLWFGLYQFTIGTWRSVGGSGLPTDASPEEQLYRAQLLYKREGAGPWPNCGSLL